MDDNEGIASIDDESALAFRAMCVEVEIDQACRRILPIRTIAMLTAGGMVAYHLERGRRSLGPEGEDDQADDARMKLAASQLGIE